MIVAERLSAGDTFCVFGPLEHGMVVDEIHIAGNTTGAGDVFASASFHGSSPPSTDVGVAAGEQLFRGGVTNGIPEIRLPMADASSAPGSAPFVVPVGRVIDRADEKFFVVRVRSVATIQGFVAVRFRKLVNIRN